MFPNNKFRVMRFGLRVERGFAMASAIFLLVILAALGGYMLTFSATQHTASALDIQSARGYQAARAGTEWGAYQVLKNTSCVASTALPTLDGDLAPFTVTVTCASFPPAPATSFSEGAHGVITYELVSTASYGAAGSIDFVERQIRTTISTCDPALPC